MMRRWNTSAVRARAFARCGRRRGTLPRPPAGFELLRRGYRPSAVMLAVHTHVRVALGLHVHLRAVAFPTRVVPDDRLWWLDRGRIHHTLPRSPATVSQTERPIAGIPRRARRAAVRHAQAGLQMSRDGRTAPASSHVLERISNHTLMYFLQRSMIQRTTWAPRSAAVAAALPQAARTLPPANRETGAQRDHAGGLARASAPTLSHTLVLHRLDARLVERLESHLPGLRTHRVHTALLPAPLRRASLSATPERTPPAAAAIPVAPLRLEPVRRHVTPQRPRAAAPSFKAQPQPLAPLELMAAGPGPQVQQVEQTLRETMSQVVERSVRHEVARALRPDTQWGRRLRESVQSELYNDIVFERERLGER